MARRAVVIGDGSSRRRPELSGPVSLSLRPEGRLMSAATAQPARAGGRGPLAALLAFGLLLLGLAVPATASADTRPDAGTPATVTADALPTVQVNGVVWSMVTVG